MGPLGCRLAGLLFPRMLSDVVYSSSHLPLINGEARDLCSVIQGTHEGGGDQRQSGRTEQRERGSMHMDRKTSRGGGRQIACVRGGHNDTCAPVTSLRTPLHAVPPGSDSPRPSSGRRGRARLTNPCSPFALLQQPRQLQTHDNTRTPSAIQGRYCRLQPSGDKARFARENDGKGH